MATKKTLKIKEFFFSDFWNETALKSPQFRFQKINQVSFVAIFSFSLITIIIVIITIVFVFSYYLTLFSIYFIYFGLLSIIIVPFFKIYFLFYLFLILSSFLFHFSSYISFFAIFLFSVLQLNPSCQYFQFYPHRPFKNSPRRTPRPFELTATLKIHCLCCFIIIRSWAGQFNFTLYFSLPSPILIYGPSFPEPLEVYETHISS